MLKRSIRAVGLTICLAVSGVAAGMAGCAHGRFVGTSYVPTKAYAGEDRPDAELASIGSGIHMGEKSGSPVLLDGLLWSVMLLSVDGQSCSGSVAQVLPGQHTLSVALRSSPRFGDNKIRWKETKPFDVVVDVEKGLAYNLMAAKKRDGSPGATLKQLCASTDHIATIKAFQQYGETVCK